jgi:endoglucanase
MYSTVFLSSLFILTTEANAQNSKSATSSPSCASVQESTCIVAKNLGRGINMGDMLESPKEGDWGLRLEPRFIDLVALDFNNVRVPVRWSNHASPDESAKIDPLFANRIDGIVDRLLKKDVYVILNMHHYSQLFGDKLLSGEFEVAPEVIEKRMINMWRQLAERYKNRSPKLIFELMNEPHGKLDSDRWNNLLAETLAVVRSKDPNRIVMVGPTDYNAAKDLSKLKLPKDQNMIVQFHSYLPFNFTHQGATWLPLNLPLGVKCCDSSQRAVIAADMELAAQWSRANGYPVFLGEFGSTQGADNNSRAEYARVARDAAQSRGISWAYWDFASSAFGIYNPKTYTWNTEIRRALLDK